jgi:hypothetical protein
LTKPPWDAERIAKVFKHPSSKQDMITQVSMNSKVILAGTEKGFTGNLGLREILP